MEELVHDIEPEIGHILRRAREEQKLSVASVAQRLHIASELVEAIESNEFAYKRTPMAFMRGYVRSYAKLVELDADAVVKIFEKIVSPESETKKRAHMHTARPHESKSSNAKQWSLFWLLVMIGALGGLYVYNPALFSLSGSDVALDADAPPLQQVAAQDAAITSDVNLTPPSNSENPVQVETGQTDGNETSLSEKTDELVASDAESAVIEDKNVVLSQQQDKDEMSLLQFKFKENCWVNVEDATGKVLATGNKLKGYVMDITGLAPFKIRLGVPNAVNITLDGHDIDLSAYPANRPANLLLDNE